VRTIPNNIFVFTRCCVQIGTERFTNTALVSAKSYIGREKNLVRMGGGGGGSTRVVYKTQLYVFDKQNTVFLV
jgi:hypothetical protein